MMKQFMLIGVVLSAFCILKINGSTGFFVQSHCIEDLNKKNCPSTCPSLIGSAECRQSTCYSTTDKKTEDCWYYICNCVQGAKAAAVNEIVSRITTENFITNWINNNLNGQISIASINSALANEVRTLATSDAIIQQLIQNVTINEQTVFSEEQSAGLGSQSIDVQVESSEQILNYIVTVVLQQFTTIVNEAFTQYQNQVQESQVVETDTYVITYN